MTRQQLFVYVLLLVLTMGILADTSVAGASAVEDGGFRVRRVDLHTLTELVIGHDPALEALRGAIAESDFEVAIGNRVRSPEIRVQYGETDDWSPRNTSTGSDTVTGSGGRCSQGVQLRLFPRNPFSLNVARQRRIAVGERADNALEAALQRAVTSVAREHREIQFMLAELKMMKRRAGLLESELADLTALKAARAIGPADYYKRHTDALIYRSRVTELTRSIVDASVRLKNRAGLDEGSRIAFAGILSPPRVDFGALDRARLVTLAEPRNVALGSVRFAKTRVVSDLEADRAERIPWVSSVSLDYGVDDTVAGQTRDEWSVYAGVSLPVGAWMDGASRLALRTRLTSVERQEVLTRRNLELAVDALCRSLGSAQADWLTFAHSAREEKAGIERQMATIDGRDLTARRTRLALNESLLDMDMQRLRLAHRFHSLLFDLCDVLGCSLEYVRSGALNRPGVDDQPSDDE